jgi:hypothetical protein
VSDTYRGATDEDWLRAAYGDPPEPEPESPPAEPAEPAEADEADDGCPVHMLRHEDENFRWLIGELGTRGLSALFLRGSTAVVCHRVGEQGYVPPRDKRDSNGPAMIKIADEHDVVALLGQHYRIRKTIRTEDGFREIGVLFPLRPAKTAMRALHAADHLRVLRGATHTPMVRADGSILVQPGYDQATGFLYLPEVDVPPVPAEPTAGQVADAVALLRGTVDEFAWLTEHDEANHLGLLLTPLLREMCPPPYKLGAYMAHQAGSGKSLLAEIGRAVHGGVFRTEMPADDAELGKSLTSILTQTTAPVVCFDNVSGILRSSRLAGLLTSPVYSDRVLGSTNSTEIPNDRLWTITGNNLSFGGDLVRRTIWVTINPDVENPHLRTGFRIANLAGWVREHRGEILHALLTLVAAWVAAGRPTPAAGSSDCYSRWITTVRGILGHAGIPGVFDHSESMQQQIGSDDEGWGDFLGEIHGEFAGRPFTARELADRLRWKGGAPPRQELVDALPAELLEKLDRQSFVKSLGWWLRNRHGRWSGGFVCDELRSRQQDGKTALYRVRTRHEGG